MRGRVVVERIKLGRKEMEKIGEQKNRSTEGDTEIEGERKRDSKGDNSGSGWWLGCLLEEKEMGGEKRTGKD